MRQAWHERGHAGYLAASEYEPRRSDASDTSGTGDLDLGGSGGSFDSGSDSSSSSSD